MAMKIDLDTNPMKPITKKNLGKNWEKGSDGKYMPHIGKKQRRKGKHGKASRVQTRTKDADEG
jgi:hypothetical protein